MKPPTRPAARPSATTVAVALLAGFVVLVLLFPASVVTTDPPVCYAMLFYVVPCEAWVAPLAGVVTAGLVAWGLWTSDHRRG